MDIWGLLQEMTGEQYGLVATVLSLIVSILMWIRTQIANSRLKKKDELLSQVDLWVQKAEQYQNYSGVEKLDKVLSWALEYCIATKTKFDKTSIVGKVEQIIQDSLTVNARGNINATGTNTSASAGTAISTSTRENTAISGKENVIGTNTIDYI